VLARRRRERLAARELLELHRGLACEVCAVLDQRRRGIRRELARAQLLGRALEARDHIIKTLHAAHRMRALSRTSRNAAPKTPLTNAGASAPQNVLAVSTASSIAPSGGIGSSAGTSSGCSISISATRMMLRSSGWIRDTDQPWAWRSLTESR